MKQLLVQLVVIQQNYSRQHLK